MKAITYIPQGILLLKPHDFFIIKKLIRNLALIHFSWSRLKYGFLILPCGLLFLPL
jgi:hypothetical protein